MFTLGFEKIAISSKLVGRAHEAAKAGARSMRAIAKKHPSPGPRMFIEVGWGLDKYTRQAKRLKAALSRKLKEGK